MNTGIIVFLLVVGLVALLVSRKKRGKKMHFPKSVHPESERHFRAIGGTDGALLRDVNNLIIDLHQNALWDRITNLCVVHTSLADTLVDVKGSQNSAASGSPTFSSTTGVECRLSGSKYVDMQTLPANEEDSSVFVYMDDVSGTLDRIFGGIIYVCQRIGGDWSGSYAGGTAAIETTATVSGLFGISRTSSASVNLHADGTTTVQASTRSGNIANDCLVGGANVFGYSGGSDINAGAWGQADGFVDADWQLLKTAVEKYLTARGFI